MEDESRYDHITQGEIINMAKKSKQMRAALEKIDSTKAYSVEEAVALAQETNFAKFDATVEKLNFGGNNCIMLLILF